MRTTILAFVALVLLTACQERGTIVKSDDITASTGPSGETIYLPANHETATAAYAQFLQLRADEQALRRTDGDYIETIAANLHQQVSLLSRAIALDWRWDRIDNSRPWDLSTQLTAAKKALADIDQG